MMKLNTLAGVEYIDAKEIVHIRPVEPTMVPKGVSENQRARIEARNKAKSMVTLKGRVAVIAALETPDDIVKMIEKGKAEK